MGRKVIALSLLLFASALYASEAGWATSKAAQQPVVHVADFGTPVAVASDLAWEDGIYITRDGKTLYSYYIPMDQLKWFLDGGVADETTLYQRGTDIGQNFDHPTEVWDFMHPDVAYAVRSSTTEDFGPWVLTDLREQIYSTGGPVGIQNPAQPSVFDVFMFTDDNPTLSRIKFFGTVDRDLAAPAAGYSLPAAYNDVTYWQDNPHVERTDLCGSSTYRMMYDSNEVAAGTERDIWWGITTDGGANWSTPAQLTDINGADYDAQPHLWMDPDTGVWWLYYSSIYLGKHAIYRAQQTQYGNFTDWGTPELVISAGDSLGVGDPTLTADGDLYFVAVFQNTVDATAYDAYDADAYMVPRQ